MAEGELRRALIISGERYLYSYPIYKYHSYSDDHYLSDHSLLHYIEERPLKC